MQNRRCPTGDFAPQNLPRGPALKRGQATTNEPVARVFLCSEEIWGRPGPFLTGFVCRSC